MSFISYHRVFTAPTPTPTPIAPQRLLTRGGLAPMRARDIVDANRESTLGMLMHLAQRWQAPRLVSLKELKAEVKRLLKVSLLKEGCVLLHCLGECFDIK